MALARAGSARSARSAASTASGRPPPPGAPPRHPREGPPARLVRPRSHEHEDIERLKHLGEIGIAIAGEEHVLAETALSHPRLERRPRASLADGQGPQTGRRRPET